MRNPRKKENMKKPYQQVTLKMLKKNTLHRPF